MATTLLSFTRYSCLRANILPLPLLSLVDAVSQYKADFTRINSDDLV